MVLAAGAALLIGFSFSESTAGVLIFALAAGFFPAVLMALGDRPPHWSAAWPFLLLGLLLSGGLLGIFWLHQQRPAASWWWAGLLLLGFLWLLPLVLVSWVFAARFPRHFQAGEDQGKER